MLTMKKRKEKKEEKVGSDQQTTVLPSQRKIRWFRWIFLLIGLTVLFHSTRIGWYGVLMGRYGPPHAPENLVVQNYTLPIANLHPSLDGLRFAHLSDIHFNDNNSHDQGTSDALLEQVVDAINNAEADLVFLTGDYVDHW